MLHLVELARQHEVTLELQHLADWFAVLLGGCGSPEVVSSAKHGVFDTIGQHLPDTAQVFSNRLHLLCDPHPEFQVGIQTARRSSGSAGLAFFVALGDEVEDGDMVRLLPVTIHSTVPLLHAIWIPRNLIMGEDEQVVALTSPPAADIWRPTVTAGTRVEYIGRIRAADETSKKGKHPVFSVEDDAGTVSPKIRVPPGVLQDIVKPYWGELVKVIASKPKRGNPNMIEIQPIDETSDEAGGEE